MNDKILIVEDNPIIALDLKATVNEFNYKVTDTVSNEKAVLSSIEHNEPNLILMDIDLGNGNNGIDIVKEIHKNKYIPIIYLSARSDQETMNKALDTSPIGYLPKPFNRIKLNSMINLALCKNT